ncbi:hypothetical protein FPHOBKDP_00213 [Listeria phage LPJP1]|nr:hypothetical protein FPHOBKDP_00213 [Listeria phage LPJP1]
MATQTINTTGMDQTTVPVNPSISISSSKPLTPFDVSSADISQCADDITITVMNNNSNYTLNCYIDGNNYTSGSTFTSGGTHEFLAVFTDRHNYTLSYTTFKFNIVKNYIYTPPRIDYNDKKYYSESYNISIEYVFIESEREHIKSKLYKTSINNSWKEYTGPFIITEPCIITARKIMDNDMILENNLEITSDMLNVTVPDLPVINIPDNSGNLTNSLIIPNIVRIPMCTYEITINGLPVYSR